MIVGFDFDKTLERKRVQDIARNYINTNNEVWIITRRTQEGNEDILKVAEELGIPTDKIIYTSGEWKWKTIKDMNIDIFYDDKIIEIILIEKNTNTKGILI